MRGAKEELRAAAEQDLFFFARLVNPGYMYGEVHKEVFAYLQREAPNQLLLLPRGHLKSHCMAVWCAWWITKYPETSILYISATTDLAEKQLYAIKNILISDIYRRYWPEMIHSEEGKREKWATGAICVDHPKRKLEGVRDPTVATAGLTTTTTGWHADVVVADDAVVPENAYTEEGRNRVESALSQMSSIKNAGGLIKACGTTYHPKDIYSVWKVQKVPIVDDNGEILGEEDLWDIFEKPVETDGVFIWPRTTRTDGKSFGFNHQVLAKIKAEYLDVTQFFAQYYLDPNDPTSEMIDRSRFQYYEPKHIKSTYGSFSYRDRPLNVYAAIDFAYSLSAKADYTAIVVIGIDADGYIYVLDIDRFKTNKISVMFEHIKDLHARWSFKKLRAEVTVAQSMIAEQLKDEIRREGMSLSIDEHRPTSKKEERMAATLEPRYANQTIYHFKGGYIPMLEEELVLARPPHDDIKDCLAAVIEIARPPAKNKQSSSNTKILYHSRFGGVRA